MKKTNLDYQKNNPIITNEAAVRMRTNALNYIGSKNEVPLFLLDFEIKKLIESVDNLKIAFFIETLWVTALKISDTLNIKLENFKEIEYRNNNGKIELSWFLFLSKNSSIQQIKILDNTYIDSLKNYVNIYNIKSNQPLFNVSRAGAYDWIKIAVKQAKNKGITFPFHINSYTFRHSHAMHLLLNGLTCDVVQERLGYKFKQNTAIYKKIFELNNDINIKFL